MIVAISVFPLIGLVAGAAVAAKAKADGIAIVAAAAPAESSAPRRVMERELSVIWCPAISSILVPGDAVFV
jgi:hypothetical protein